jgi:hypothetical protein
MWTGAVVLMLAGSVGLGAQIEFNNNIKYNSGQDVQPVYEGWARVPDGSFDLYFGYLNRNWLEQLNVPIGPNNNVEPGGPDRGQPTFFYTRTNRKIFKINVPSDFGRNEVVWTLTVNGIERSAYGTLQADWEITADGGASGTRTTTEARTNKPPTVMVAPVSSIALSGSVSLVATVSDDGLPVPRPRAKAAVGQEIPPTLAGGVDAPVNLPFLATDDEEKRPDGLTVTWFVLRGPADAQFDPTFAQPVDGKATTTVRFTQPGDYVLQAHVQDGLMTTQERVSITVTR